MRDPVPASQPQGITLARPLRLFGRTLGLVPGVAGQPDPDFLVRLLTGHLGHRAWLRQAAGDLYPHLENALHGKALRQATRQRIHQRLGLDDAQLAQFLSLRPPPADDAQQPRGRHLLPRLLAMLGAGFAAPAHWHERLVAWGPVCPHCRSQVLQELDPWWNRVAPAAIPGAPERRFLEGLLLPLVYAEFLGTLLGHTLALEGLTAPGKHPVGHWLTQLKHCLHARDFHMLADHVHVEQPRLKRWSAGIDFMPPSATDRFWKALAPVMPGPALRMLQARLVAARTLSLAIDFLEAASPPGVSGPAARGLVAGRVRQIRATVDLGMRCRAA